ncbi:probable glutamate carboxypeptidase AMP1 isoform X2 [Salvia hispanica]|uniref:probable glutamate carboxypeptidase AMP1 isoform X2 n=1 Tax=Salvia hispanica TaxID=49212 RepID=UPI0020099094|nr:probable glutamate carboxypeptidase AMP1 isoform X2 [Salvia hispanica]
MVFSGKNQTHTLLFFLTLSLLTLYALHHRHRHPFPSPSSPAATLFLSSGSNSTVAAYLRQLTLRPHLAGTPLSLSTALYVLNQFRSLGLPAHTANFSALLSYPSHSSLSAHFSNGSIFNFAISEPSAPNDVVPPYHAYSPSGSAHAPAVFLNCGSERDYLALAASGVDVRGCVGLLRRGCGLSRHEAAANAAARGVAAVLMYTEGGFKEGVERGTVMEGLGDPLRAGGERLEEGDPRVVRRFPGIPSMPLSEAAAERILGSLEGARMPLEWRESFGTGNSTRFWGVGPGPTMLNFTYQGKQKMETIHNVFAVIKGSEEADRYVLLGNHRDAWTYGAVDPNSGTAALLDIARRLSLLMRSGWRPRRTIILCSWDAEEFGMIGSTEWVEQNLLNLGSKAVAYFNVDCAVQGPGLFVSATPQLDDLFVEVTKQVKDPDSDNEYVYERWVAANRGVNIQRLSRVDSDFASFLQHAGVASIDLYFGIDFPAYHTAFDSYDWMMNFGDPLFHRHVAVAGIWGLVALRLADDPILPFNYISYATELQDFRLWRFANLTALQKYKNALSTLLGESISLDPITAAIQEFTTAAYGTDEEIKKLRVDGSKDVSTLLRRRALNDRLMLAERGFLDPEGLPGRQWLKHLIYGPCGDTESKIEFFPGIADCISEYRERRGEEARIRHEIWRVSRAIQRAASALRGELT